MEYDRPWQQGPAEMIRMAIVYGRSDDDFYNRVSFLMIDVGVEITLKVFISLPSDVTGLNSSYTKKCEATQGSFYKLIQFIKESVGDRLSGDILDEVLYYHSNIRNKLYHEGYGITVSRHTVQRYAELAVIILQELMGVNLTTNNNGQELHEREKKELTSLCEELDLCIERLLPAIMLPAFRNRIYSIDESKPLVALWDLSRAIETVFSVEFERCFSEDHISLINKHLAETCGTDVSYYKSKKDIVLQVSSGLIGWEYMKIVNLPVGNHIVNSLKVSDFIAFNEFEKGEHYNIYLKIICEIIDTEVLSGNYSKPLKGLMEIAKDCYFLSGPYFYLSEYDHVKMVESLVYLRDSIKSWRVERLV